MDKVREDLDRIAELSGGESGWDHNVQYHDFRLRQLPDSLSEALEVGCGTGAFARSLAGRSDRVLAIDLSPRMVEVARARSRGCPNIEYAVADANSWGWTERRFDCVASIMTMHHLPLRPMLARMRGCVRQISKMVSLFNRSDRRLAPFS